MTHERRRSSAAGHSWRKWEPSSWEIEYRRKLLRDHNRRLYRLLAGMWIVLILGVVWMEEHHD